MSKFFRSRFNLTKRYTRFSTTLIYFNNKSKEVRYGYKYYQKVFKKYRSSGNLRINVRKPRLATKRKTTFGKAIEMKEKFTYLLGGLHASKLQRYCRLSSTKYSAPALSLLTNLEQRIDVVLYRSNFVSNPKFAKNLISKGYVLVNGRPATGGGQKVRVNDVLSFKPPTYFYNNLLSDFKFSVLKRLIFKPSVPYLQISYKLFKIIVSRKPVESEVFYPFNFNIQYFYRLYS